MLIAHAAGIPIMATGGIGGVHRGAELTFDISADLVELGRTPVAVVCSGVKSILDIGKTLEYLVAIWLDIHFHNSYNLLMSTLFAEIDIEIRILCS